MRDSPSLSVQALGTRWLGVGLASALAVVTLGLAVTGRLGLYINPDSTWFAVGMAVVVLAGAAASFALPLGAESDHGHDHGDHAVAEPAEAAAAALRHAQGSAGAQGPAGAPPHRLSPLSLAATVIGGAAASVVVVLALALPPASLSAEFAMSRDVGATPLFGGADAVSLAATGDTASFGVGDWATVFATATNPDAFDGDPVVLTGFAMPGADGADFDLTRLVITHCVIDAQPASVPVVTSGPVPAGGQWVTVTGTVRSTSDGRLEIDAATVEQIPEPEDPYEY